MSSSQIKSFQEATVELGLSGLRVIQMHLDAQKKILTNQVFKGIVLFGALLVGSILVLLSSAHLIGESLSLDPHWVLLSMGSFLIAGAIILFTSIRKGSS